MTMARPASSSGVSNGTPSVRRISALPGSGPTVPRRLLGAQLRRLREERGITLEDAGEVIRASGSKMSRLETGRVGFKDRDIADLLTFYEVTDEQKRGALRELARSASAHGWWHDYSDVLPAWFEAYIGLEEAATSIRAYEIQFVPGLLQTEDYARAVTLLGHDGAPAAEIDQRVELRMARQGLLTGPQPTHLWAVLDEAVLRRPAGRPGVMRRQLQHILQVAERPNVTIQVIPFAAGAHAAAGGPFSILRFSERDLADVVYLEQLTSALYLDKRETVDHYMAVMERLCLEATPAVSTAKTINAILRDR
jgi:transcriptional regulator with XRE-family HTH domain